MAHEILLNGKEGSYHAIGSINHVCQASATLCKKLEAHAVQSEFEEMHRSDANPVPASPAEEMGNMEGGIAFRVLECTEAFAESTRTRK